MAATIYMRRTPHGLAPDMLHDRECLEKYPVGALVKCTVTNPRSVPHHRMYWGILSRWIEATGRGYDSKHLHKKIKLDLGYTEDIKVRGIVHTVPDSIEFEQMDQAEFNTFFEQAMALLAEAGGFDPMTLRQEAA